MEVLGWAGSLLLAICVISQANYAMRKGFTHLSYSFLLMWLLGDILILIPVQETYLVFNFVFNIACLSIILKYKIWPREVSGEVLKFRRKS